MNFWRLATKVFAFIFLLFVNFTFLNAQTDSSIYQLQAGTIMRLQMDNEINSKVASVNDTFTTTLTVPVKVQEMVVLPVGTVIEGRVTKVKRASYGGRGGSLEVSFQTLQLLNGGKRGIEGVLVTKLKAETSQTANVLTILGGTALGGIVGAVSRSQNGSLIGAGVGAGAGTSVAFLRKGSDVKIRAAEEFEIKLTKTVNLPVQDY
ncbi:MAG: hypothetical protein H0X49_13675 [Acidobacteria bacterium]|nr:hypothetical protein [Acidobacteriota bacterium]MBA4185035.1 hypothetical protein [Acidobacteriota bacterium]